jgi:hypothetical protein
MEVGGKSGDSRPKLYITHSKEFIKLVTNSVEKNLFWEVNRRSVIGNEKITAVLKRTRHIYVMSQISLVYALSFLSFKNYYDIMFIYV